MGIGGRLLCYQLKAPLLRVLDLQSLEIESLPTPWDNGNAIDTAWHRRSWLAVDQTSRGIIRMEASLSGPGRLLGRTGYTPFPALSADHMWLCDPEGREYGEPHLAQEIDGDGKVIRELNLPGGAFLRDELDKQFIVQVDRDHYAWSGRGPIKERAIPTGLFLGALHNTMFWVAIDTQSTLHWAGAHNGAVAPAEVDHWTRTHFSPSPDGSKVAIPFGSTTRGRGGLAILELGSGSCTVVSGDFNASTYRPVWSLDGASIFLGLPFERQIARVDTNAPEMKRLALKNAPMPILAL